MGKRIVSFSLWGDNPLYIDGAVSNADLIQKIYPGWIARFYHDNTVPSEILLNLRLRDYVEMVEMPKSDGALGMFWRFRPMFDDKNVERFIVRDTDSTIGEREAAAVRQWIDSGKAFHIIRDSPAHNISILGGTWGSVGGLLPEFEVAIANFIHNVGQDPKNPRGAYHGQDQVFLGGVVWPDVKHNQLAHIRAGCGKLRYSETDVELPPWKEGDRYVGMVG